ncbi:hypothetical protein V6Z11_D13G068800 [Gossypium hirsutum]
MSKIRHSIAQRWKMDHTVCKAPTHQAKLKDKTLLSCNFMNHFFLIIQQFQICHRIFHCTPTIQRRLTRKQNPKRDVNKKITRANRQTKPVPRAADRFIC